MLPSDAKVCKARERHNGDEPDRISRPANWHTTSTSILEMMRMRPSCDFAEAKGRAVAWITAWDSQGPHRTGSASDEAAVRRLTQEAAADSLRLQTQLAALAAC